MTFTKLQPRDGETIMHCGHLERKPHHFYSLGAEPIEFMRPDKTKGKSRWIVLCETCHRIHCLAPQAAIRADGEWIGNEPEIKENFN